MSGNALHALTLFGALAATIGAGALYLRRVSMPRPPLGTFVASDIAVMGACLVVTPLLYLHLPSLFVGALFGLVFVSAAAMALTPAAGNRIGTVSSLVLGGLVLLFSLRHLGLPHVVCSDLLLAIAVVGVANLWAQSGITAAQVAALAAILTPYDLIATSLTTVTGDLVRHLSSTPFMPMLTVSVRATPIAAGLGDCLILTLWPLVACKAYGRAAGRWGAVIGLAVVGAILGGVLAGWLTGGVPLLTPLGPCIIAQHFFWRARRGRERTTLQWRGSAWPVPADPAAAVFAAVRTAAAMPDRALPWIAVRDGEVVGLADTPGRARRAAREAAGGQVPVVVAVLPRDTQWQGFR